MGKPPYKKPPYNPLVPSAFPTIVHPGTWNIGGGTITITKEQASKGTGHGGVVTATTISSNEEKEEKSISTKLFETYAQKIKGAQYQQKGMIGQFSAGGRTETVAVKESGVYDIAGTPTGSRVSVNIAKDFASEREKRLQKQRSEEGVRPELLQAYAKKMGGSFSRKGDIYEYTTGGRTATFLMGKRGVYDIADVPTGTKVNIPQASQFAKTRDYKKPSFFEKMLKKYGRYENIIKRKIDLPKYDLRFLDFANQQKERSKDINLIMPSNFQDLTVSTLKGIKNVPNMITNIIPSKASYAAAEYTAGAYAGLRKKPLTTGVSFGISFVTGGVSKYLGTAGKIVFPVISGIYASSVASRIIGSDKKFYTAGMISSTEIVPVALGGLAGSKAQYELTKPRIRESFVKLNYARTTYNRQNYAEYVGKGKMVSKVKAIIGKNKILVSDIKIKGVEAKFSEGLIEDVYRIDILKTKSYNIKSKYGFEWKSVNKKVSAFDYLTHLREGGKLKWDYNPTHWAKLPKKYAGAIWKKGLYGNDKPYILIRRDLSSEIGSKIKSGSVTAFELTKALIKKPDKIVSTFFTEKGRGKIISFYDRLRENKFVSEETVITHELVHYEKPGFTESQVYHYAKSKNFYIPKEELFLTKKIKYVPGEILKGSTIKGYQTLSSLDSGHAFIMGKQQVLTGVPSEYVYKGIGKISTTPLKINYVFKEIKPTGSFKNIFGEYQTGKIVDVSSQSMRSGKIISSPEGGWTLEKFTQTGVGKSPQLTIVNMGKKGLLIPGGITGAVMKMPAYEYLEGLNIKTGIKSDVSLTRFLQSKPLRLSLSIPKMETSLMLATIPSMKRTIKPIGLQKPAIIQKSLLIPKMAISSKVTVIPKNAVIPKQILVPKLIPKTALTSKSVVIPKIIDVPKEIPKIPSPIRPPFNPPPPPVNIHIPFEFDLDITRTKKKKKKELFLTRKSRYSPSWAAVELNIKRPGKPPKFTSGIGIRPIYKMGVKI